MALFACSSGSSAPQGLVTPAAPTQVTFRVVGPDSIQLTWTDATSLETGFRIERGPNPFINIVDLPADSTSFTDTPPARRTPWEYRLFSFNAAGESESSNSVFFKSSDPPAPEIARFHPASTFEGSTGELTFVGSGLLNFEAGLNVVSFGGVPSSAVLVLDDQKMLVRPPSGIAGIRDVLVTNLNGSFMPVQQLAYAAWPPTLTATDRRLDTDVAGAAESDSAELAADGDRIYAVWADDRNGSLDVYFNRSLDGGLSWLSADRRLDSDITGTDSTDLSLCAEGESVWVVWSDTRNGSGDIFFNRSLDAGTTWLSEETRLDTRDSGFTGSAVPEVACSGESVFVAWREEQEFSFFAVDDVYANRSTDAGTTWLEEELRLDAGLGCSDCIEIDASPEVVTVVWQDDRDGEPDIYVNSSFDDGLTWQVEPVRVSSSARGTTTSITPTVAVSGMNVHVAWEDNVDVGLDIFANRSLDGGVTWLRLPPRVNTNTPGSSNSLRPRIAVENQNVYVVWEDTRNIRGPRFNRSLDAGATWLNEDVLVSPDAIAFNLQVAVSGGNVHVAWEDSRLGQRDIYLSSSRDEGLTFQPLDLQVSSDVPGASGSRNPRVAASGTRAYVIWTDFRNGEQDIFFRDTIDPRRQQP